MIQPCCRKDIYHWMWTSKLTASPPTTLLSSFCAVSGSELSSSCSCHISMMSSYGLSPSRTMHKSSKLFCKLRWSELLLTEARESDQYTENLLVSVSTHVIHLRLAYCEFHCHVILLSKQSSYRLVISPSKSVLKEI